MSIAHSEWCGWKSAERTVGSEQPALSLVRALLLLAGMGPGIIREYVIKTLAAIPHGAGVCLAYLRGQQDVQGPLDIVCQGQAIPGIV